MSIRVHSWFLRLIVLTLATGLRAQEPPVQPPPPAEPPVEMSPVTVTAHPQTQLNTIDRKVYNVGRDIQSVTGSASDLLRNVPSVGIDLDGKVSLRGSTDVQILIDGKPSAMLGGSTADALDGMDASTIERIEVITNPSARYRPDGGAGIINIVRSRAKAEGLTASVRAAAGNDQRANASVAMSLKRGPVSLRATAGFRQAQYDDEILDRRRLIDGAGRTVLALDEVERSNSRPLTREASAGFDYEPNARNRFGAEARYEQRRRLVSAAQDRRGVADDGSITVDDHWLYSGPLVENQVEFESHWQRTFGPNGHALKLEFRRGTDDEDNTQTFSRAPSLLDAHYPPDSPVVPFQQVVLDRDRTRTDFSADYTRPTAPSGKIEAGYAWSEDRAERNERYQIIDPPLGGWLGDPVRSHDFVGDQGVHAGYVTWERAFGRLGVLAGLRGELAETDVREAATGAGGKSDYARLYPSLHLSWNLDESQQVQASYSHRVRRPRSEELDPFPDARDPYAVRVGNPHLEPEDIHSLELGWQYKQNETTYLATVYYRNHRNGITETTAPGNDGVLVTTLRNLVSSRSGGLELVANVATPGRRLSFDLSSNLFYSEIDAGNLGYTERRSTVAWAAKLGARLQLSKRDAVQVNADYTARHLTPQGEFLPQFILNVGIRHQMKNEKLAFVLTATDVLDSAEESSRINTPSLQREKTHSRAAPLIYAGFTYSFGRRASKSDTIEFEPDAG